MTTKAELIAQCKAENPTMTATINDETIQLNAADYEKACSDWADMRLGQIADDAAKAQAASDKAVLLEKLGISNDEAKLLLS